MKRAFDEMDVTHHRSAVESWTLHRWTQQPVLQSDQAGQVLERHSASLYTSGVSDIAGYVASAALWVNGLLFKNNLHNRCPLRSTAL